MFIFSIYAKDTIMSAPIIRSSTDIRRDYNSIEALAKETGKPIYLTKNGRASLVVMDAAAFDYDRRRGHRAQQAASENVYRGRSESGNASSSRRKAGRP